MELVQERDVGLAHHAGLAAMVVGVRILQLGLTNSPGISGTGFLLSGLGGLLVLPVLMLRKVRLVRVLAAVVLLVAAIIWARTGLLGYSGHMKRFGKWQPATMKQTGPEQK